MTVQAFSSLPVDLVSLLVSLLDVASRFSLSMTSSSSHKFLKESFSSVSKKALFEDAAETGSVTLVKWLLASFGCDILDSPLIAAAKCTKQSYNSNLRGGHLEILQLFPETMIIDSPPDLSIAAARGNHVHVLDWLRKLIQIPVGDVTSAVLRFIVASPVLISIKQW